MASKCTFKHTDLKSVSGLSWIYSKHCMLVPAIQPFCFVFIISTAHIFCHEQKETVFFFYQGKMMLPSPVFLLYFPLSASFDTLIQKCLSYWKKLLHRAIKMLNNLFLPTKQSITSMRYYVKSFLCVCVKSF